MDTIRSELTLIKNFYSSFSGSEKKSISVNRLFAGVGGVREFGGQAWEEKRHVFRASGLSPVILKRYTL